MSLRRPHVNRAGRRGVAAAVVLCGALALGAGGCVPRDIYTTRSRSAAQWTVTSETDVYVAAGDSPEELRQYLAAYPDGRHADEARRRIERFDFQTAAAKQSIPALEAFLEAHPQDEHAPDARRMLQEERDWTSAEARNTEEAYRAFLTAHPQSKRASLVRGRIASFAFDAATDQGDVARVEQLLAEGLDANAPFPDGTRPLFVAGARGADDVVGLLLKAGADVDGTDSAEATPLMIAAQEGHQGTVGLLIAAGATVDHQRRDAVTALWLAAHQGRADVVDMLIAAGAEVDARQYRGPTVLHAAAMNGHAAIVKRLLLAGAAVRTIDVDNGVSPLYDAAKGGHAEVVALLLKAGADVNAARTPPGNQAGQMQILSSFARRTHGQTPLYTAAANGHARIVAMLIEAGADLNAPCTHFEATALRISSHEGASEVGTTYETTPLQIAESNGHADVVELLRAAGAR